MYYNRPWRSGTGKTVIAVNLLAELTQRDQLVQYFSKNSAPRQVYLKKLKGQIKKSSVDNMFIGSVAEIEKWAKEAGSELHYLELESQFRCNGSDGYLAWLDDVLDIRETANYDLEGIDYDIRICDTPGEMRELVIERNRISNRARVLAGYCWEWFKKEQNNTDYHDIKIGDFEMSWNLGSGEPFAVSETSINEAGCIHTSQGLEFDYVGVIMGDDIRFENGHVVTDFTRRAKTDQSLKGIKKLYKESPEEAKNRADVLVYTQDLLDKFGLDADEIVNMKMEQNERKYPVEKAKGNAAKYDQL